MSITQPVATIERLPNEILYNILVQMPDLPTAVNLLKTIPFFKQLFLQRSDAILSTILENALGLQFSKIAWTILSLRYGPLSLWQQRLFSVRAPEPHRYAHSRCWAHHDEELDDITDAQHYMDVQHQMDLHLEGNESRSYDGIRADHPGTQSPLPILNELASISQDTEYWTAAFIKSRCRRPRKTPGSPVQEESRSHPASTAELYRIRRAFWRFWLLCNLAYPRTGPDCWVSGDNPKWFAISFIARLTEWELEEMRCIYHFLQAEYHAFFATKNFTLAFHSVNELLVAQQPAPIRRLLLNMGYRPSAIIPRALDEIENWGPSFLLSTLDLSRTYNLTKKLVNPRTSWTNVPNGVNSPNIGWERYTIHMGLFSYLRFNPRRVQRWNRVVCIFNWGYCFWDLERLRRWEILYEPIPARGPGLRIDLRLWQDGFSGGPRCSDPECNEDLWVMASRRE
ncbi:MAG: hypothetical protein L6R40_006155 [Gallowayella cf. fulva]|nr:MAG: hypothetical protein L6R40_006155 [Xanthomendoza cf. fulva]